MSKKYTFVVPEPVYDLALIIKQKVNIIAKARRQSVPVSL